MIIDKGNGEDGSDIPHVRFESWDDLERRRSHERRPKWLGEMISMMLGGKKGGMRKDGKKIACIC